jgi:hypothetical protein
LGKSYATGDVVAKAIPRELHITIEKSLERSAELKELYNTSEEAKEILDMAKQVEGMPRHASTHAAGVVISRLPVYKYVPLQENDGQLITQFPMTTLEELGLLKMDFLGLRTVTVIDELNGKDFEKVVLMFGDNECGWSSYDSFVVKYSKVIAAVRERLPKAEIYLHAVLPVSVNASATNEFGCNNTNINALNIRIEQLAAKEALSLFGEKN